MLEKAPRLPNTRLLDLLRIASAVFFTDRIVVRDRRSGPSAWPRTIALALEVTDPHFWSDRAISQRLHDVLRFVSGDDWAIHFLARPANRSAGRHWQRPLDSAFFPSNPRLRLYSGGLDSAAGLARQLSVPDNRPIVAIAVRHRPDLGGKVRFQLNSMRKHFKRELHSVIVPFEMSNPSKLVQSEERSQRSRAFLFVAIGAALADGFGINQLEVFESGIGAINAPLLAGMEGSQATRGSHPHFLYLMSALLKLVIGRPFDVILPFRDFTKGELVAVLSKPDLRQIANATCSCPSFPVRVRGGGPQQSCGICAACLFRRLAMHSAGIEESGKDYQYDFLSPDEVIPKKKLRCLLAFLNQVDSLSEIELGKPPLCIQKHLRQTFVYDRGYSNEMIVNLYQRYQSEWIRLIRRAQSNGCRWTKLIDLPSKAA